MTKNKKDLLLRLKLAENLYRQADAILKEAAKAFEGNPDGVERFMKEDYSLKANSSTAELAFKALSDVGLLDDWEEGNKEELPYPIIKVNSEYPRHIDLHVPLHNGLYLTAYASESDFGTMQAGMTQSDKNTYAVRDISMAEVRRGELATIKGLPEDNHDVNVYLWRDPQDEDYTDEFAIPEKEEWECTDADTFQYERLVKRLEKKVIFAKSDEYAEVWDMMQADGFPDGSYIVKVERDMSLLDYDPIVIGDIVGSHYESLENLMKEHPDDWQQLALECIFEMSQPTDCTVAWTADDEDEVRSIEAAVMHDAKVQLD